MRHLNLQFKPEKAPKLDPGAVRIVLEVLSRDHSLVAGFETSQGDDKGPYMNFTFLVKDLPRFWLKVKKEVLGHPEIGAELALSSIIVCEGKGGWDEYLLLHHFDPKLELDRIDDD
jgi:hypothetical protein